MVKDINKDTIIEIPIDKIDNFPNHPYKVQDDEKMYELADSIKEVGILNPVIVRKKDDRYEMISGHRRKRASQIADKKSIIARVMELTDKEAIILMVDSNENQREEILPSEKAFAYKMKMDAISHQGKEDTSTPLVSKIRSNELVGQEEGDSREQVRRYIRLTNLIPSILNMVDEKRIAFRPAVEISYLSKNNQKDLYEIMSYSDATPSLAQAIQMKKLQQAKKLDSDVIDDIMSQEKPNQIEKIKINADRFESQFPKGIVSNKEKEDFLFLCVQEHNQRIRNKNKSLER